MDYGITQAWGLLDKIWFNWESWDLDRGGKWKIEPDYDCVKTYSQSGMIEKLSGDFHLDSDVVLQNIKDYTKHLQVPLEKWEHHTKRAKEARLVSVINENCKIRNIPRHKNYVKMC